MKDWWVYILKGNFFYVGSTWNLDERLQQHQDWYVITTRKIWNFELVRWISCDNKEQATRLEKKIKKSWHYERWVCSSVGRAEDS